MFYRICAMIMSFIFPVISFLFPAGSAENPMNEEQRNGLINTETQYIMSLILENGAIAQTVPHYDYTLASLSLPDKDGVSGDVYSKWKTASLNPYFSSETALGLLHASPEKSKDAVKSYIEWYLSKLNTISTDINSTDATIYDYRAFIDPDDSSHIIEIPSYELYSSDGDSTKNSHAYDSTDSYAALFISVVAQFSREYNDKEYIASHSEEIECVVCAMMSTYNTSLHLTGAKPDYSVYYLMDNCEVYSGLMDAAYIFNDVLNNSQLGDYCLSTAGEISESILTKLYNPFNGNFCAALSSNGDKLFSSSLKAVKNFYPEGAAQLFPIIFGVVSPDSVQAKTVYGRFIKNFSASWSSCSADAFPWTIIARAVKMMGDEDLLKMFCDNAESKYISENHKYPYYNAEAGNLLTALAS